MILSKKEVSTICTKYRKTNKHLKQTVFSAQPSLGTKFNKGINPKILADKK